MYIVDSVIYPDSNESPLCFEQQYALLRNCEKTYRRPPGQALMA